MQNLAEFTCDLLKGRLLRQLKVEASDAAFEVFEAEKAAVRASVGYV
jgi:hypothetical protein